MTILWQPSVEAIQNSQIRKFQLFLKENLNIEIGDYNSLHQWSIKNPIFFWQALWDFYQVIASKPPLKIKCSTGKAFYQTTWFEGAKLNFAQNLLRGNSEDLALSFINEENQKTQLTYLQLTHKVAKLSNAMRQKGIQEGDRIVGLMPNCVETVIAMLATATLGAVWSSCSPDFGFQGIIDRFGQITPKLLFTVDGYQYNSKSHSCLEKIAPLLNAIKSLEQIIICPFNEKSPNISSLGLEGVILFNDYLSDDLTLAFEHVDFNHPLYIMYSSGTTGVPKCIVHSVGGTLIQHLKELSLHTNLTHKDTLFFFTTCGWMMWNWMISGLALGAHILLYDGSPSLGRADHLFKLVENFHVSIFGCGAKYIDAVEKAGINPKEYYAFKNLKTILSTGSPLSHHSFDFVYQQIKSDVQLSSISGGTDIVSCFALGNPTLPVYRGELQCIGLGLDVAIYNSDAQAVTAQKGELVCRQPFPCMPIYFWNDPNHQKYHEAYFNRFEHCWAHGDYAELTPNKGLIIYGRADATLNPGGVRIGTAEIYRQVEKIEAVLDSVVIGQPWQDDERVILFVQLKKDECLSEALIKQIKQTIRKNTTPRHVPALVIAVNAIPRTISGKVVEMAVKKVVCRESVNNLDALSNPESLEQYNPKYWSET